MSRVAIVGGCRTPFVRAGGKFAGYSFLDLGEHAVKSLINRLSLDPKLIDEIVYSTVLLDPRYPNAAREIVFRSGMSLRTPAHFISNNCISGLVAINMIAEGILSNRLAVGIAGGSESMSQPALALRKSAEKFWIAMGAARSLGARLQILQTFRPRMLLPIPPSPKEPSTGLTMGEHCEITAKEFGIRRETQDHIALRSHSNAAKAEANQYLADEIVPLGSVTKDNLIRGDTSLEKLASLRTVFDKTASGTLTAGNSSALTDGASAVCLMSEEQANKANLKILGYLEATEFAAIAPNDGLLMAPSISLPKLMHKQGLSIADVDVFEIHEAFAAQVAANLLVWEKGWEKFPEIRPIGKIPEDKINPNGGSIAIGHPFAATGGRLILSALNHLQRTQQNTAVISVCAAGAMACAMLLRRT